MYRSGRRSDRHLLVQNRSNHGWGCTLIAIIMEITDKLPRLPYRHARFIPRPKARRRAHTQSKLGDRQTKGSAPTATGPVHGVRVRDVLLSGPGQPSASLFLSPLCMQRLRVRSDDTWPLRADHSDAPCLNDPACAGLRASPRCRLIRYAALY